MRQIRTVLQYRYDQKMSLERIALALRISKGSVYATVARFKASGLSWPLPGESTDSGLEESLYGSHEQVGDGYVLDMEHIRHELNRKHVTAQLLWREYQQAHAEGMSRASFFRRCKEAVPSDVDLKMIYKGGDKLLIDYSGDGPSYVNRSTGEIIECELFIACWAASSYSYAVATATQRADEFCVSHVNAFEFFGCIPHALVPDNLKSGVKKPDRYEPTISPLYESLAQHYGIAVLPARVRKPKDKAGVESATGFVQRYILGRLRNRTFFSLHEINLAIWEELHNLNREPMQLYGGRNRLQRFEDLDKPHAQPLPADRFVMTDVKYDVTVGPNYHVRYDDHYYSVPSHLARRKIDLFLVGSTLELYHDGTHLCRHLKKPGNFGYTTIDEHMPAHHKFVRGWSREWFLERAGHIGPETTTAAETIMKRRRHPQQGFNSVLGLLNLVKTYTPARLELACARATRFCCVNYQSIKSILEKNLDSTEVVSPVISAVAQAPVHENLRGADYFAALASQGEVCYAS